MNLSEVFGKGYKLEDMKMTKTITLENGTEVKISEESYNELVKAAKEEVELVPDNIKIERNAGSGDSLGIGYNDNKQVLYYFAGIYEVDGAIDSDFIKCKLVKIDPSERKVGHTYFMTSCNDLRHKDKLYLYCKYLGNNKYVHVDIYRSVVTLESDWKNWYKVVPVED